MNPCSKHVPRSHAEYLLPVARPHHLLYSATTMYLLIITPSVCIYNITMWQTIYSNAPICIYLLYPYLHIYRKSKKSEDRNTLRFHSMGCVDKKITYKQPFSVSLSVLLGPWLLRNHRRRRRRLGRRGPRRCVCVVIRTTTTRVRNLFALFIYIFFWVANCYIIMFLHAGVYGKKI